MRENFPLTALSLEKHYSKNDRHYDEKVCVYIPRRFWIALTLWLGLGLGRKPEERPEVEEGERDETALLLGVLRGLLEVEQPRAGSCTTV